MPRLSATPSRREPRPAAAPPAREAATRRQPTATPSWSDRHFRLVLVLLAVLALAVRVGYVLGWKHPTPVVGDAFYYHYGANLLADGRGFLDPYVWRLHHVSTPGGQHPPGYIAVLALASLAGARSYLSHQLFSCLLGTATVALVGVTGRRMAGSRTGLLAALVGAVYPNFWFPDAFVLSETLVLLTCTLTLLLAYRLWERRSAARAAALGAAVAAALLTRAELVLLVPLLVVPLVLMLRGLAWRRRAVLLAAALGTTAALLAPWVGYNAARFAKPVVVSAGLGPVLAVANCPDTYSGPDRGWWSYACFAHIPTPPGDASQQETVYEHLATTYARAHEGAIPGVVWARLGRTFGFYDPVGQVRRDTVDAREQPADAAALGAFYLLAALSVVGVVALRRRRVPVLPPLALVASVAVTVMVIYGTTRFRAAAEPAFVLLGAVGADALLRRARDARRNRPTAGRDAASGYFPAFEGLRGVAALLVVIVHTAFVAGFTPRSTTFGDYTARGEIGVAVFFLISGFLLYRPFTAAHLAGRPPPATRSFLLRRALRIVPLYWVVLTVTFLAQPASRHGGPGGLLVYYLFGQVYSRSWALHGVTQAWTLCIEVTFYLFLPVYALAVRHRRASSSGLRREVAGLVVLYAVSVAFRLWTLGVTGGLGADVAESLPAYLDMFALGMGLAVASAWLTSPDRRPGRAVLDRLDAMPGLGAVSWGLAAVAYWLVSRHAGLSRLPLAVPSLGHAMLRQLLYGLFGLFLLLPAVFGRPDRGLVRRLLTFRPVAYLGLVSYGVYLWHQLVIAELLEHTSLREFQVPWARLLLLVLGISVVVSSASYLLVERPGQAIGRRAVLARRERTAGLPAVVRDAGPSAQPSLDEPEPVGAAAGPEGGSTSAVT